MSHDTELKAIRTPRRVGAGFTPEPATDPHPAPVRDVEEPAELPRVELRTEVSHRGRTFTIVASGMTLDQFCDLLDRRSYAPPAARAAVEAEKAREAPICAFHGPMKESTKRPGSWYCPSKMGDGSYCTSKA